MNTVIDTTRRSTADKAREKAKGDGGLYKPRTPIYPKLVHGQWRRIKWALLILTLTIYYVTPWLRWDRPGALPDQAVLVDFFGGRFYFFGIQLWPQEVHFITGLLVIAALALFLVTALFGRLWCGYACPQTVWTDLYIYIERAFEGDRNARMRLAGAPWSFDKLWRKGGKHAVWLGVAFGTGGAWIFYFRDAPTLLVEFWTGRAPIESYVSCALLTATTYIFAGHLREQVCTYMCPWPRIQAALIDRDTLMVTYRTDRGEKRGPHKKGQPWEGRGHCIDCNQCVAACPMGIDIRDGDQLECINCALCIDACDAVMKRVGLPTGLIAYDSPQNIQCRLDGTPVSHRLIRPRVILYAAVLLTVAGVMLYGLTTRATIDLNVLRDRNPTYVRLSDGSIRNAYTVKVMNRSQATRVLRMTVEAPKGHAIKVIGMDNVTLPVPVEVPADRIRTLRVLVTVPDDSVTSSSMPVSFIFTDGSTRESRRNDTVFLSEEE
jgi:cytochrome c oxidase accessory protein FixG